MEVATVSHGIAANYQIGTAAWPMMLKQTAAALGFFARRSLHACHRCAPWVSTALYGAWPLAATLVSSELWNHLEAPDTMPISDQQPALVSEKRVRCYADRKSNSGAAMLAMKTACLIRASRQQRQNSLSMTVSCQPAELLDVKHVTVTTATRGSCRCCGTKLSCPTS